MAARCVERRSIRVKVAAGPTASACRHHETAVYISTPHPAVACMTSAVVVLVPTHTRPAFRAPTSLCATTEYRRGQVCCRISDILHCPWQLCKCLGHRQTGSLIPGPYLSSQLIYAYPVKHLNPTTCVHRRHPNRSCRCYETLVNMHPR